MSSLPPPTPHPTPGFPATDHLPDESPVDPAGRGLEDGERAEILGILLTYWNEAQNARATGSHARDQIWEDNWDLYWNQFDFTKKADWQAKEVLPEASNLIERFSATVRRALIQAGQWWDTETGAKEIENLANRMIQRWLDRAGRNAQGHEISFNIVFGDIVKIAALMMGAVSVTWEDGVGIRVEAVDPRDVWIDHAGRGLYRIYRYEIDRHELDALKEKKDAEGKSLYDADAIDRLTSKHSAPGGQAFPGEQQGSQGSGEREINRERSSGHTQARASGQPIEMLEFLCTLVKPDGTLIGKNLLVTVANGQEIVRGPEPNPFRHGKDWIVVAPVIRVPFSPYGRSYAENHFKAAHTFVEFTNAILDGATQSILNAYGLKAGFLEDPSQIEDGVYAGKTFHLTEDAPKDWFSLIETGRLDPSVIAVWQELQRKFREAANQDEVTLGRVPTKTHIPAAAHERADESQSVLVAAIAQDLEIGLLAPVIELVWWTALQHIDEDTGLTELDPELQQMLLARREEFFDRRFRFKAHGISGILERFAQVRAILQMLQVVGTNELLANEFVQKVSIGKLVDVIMRGFGVDTKLIEKTPEERRQEAASAGALGVGGVEGRQRPTPGATAQGGGNGAGRSRQA